MKRTRLLLSCMVVAVMTSAYADDNDPQHQAERRAEMNKQRANVPIQATTTTNQAPAMHFTHLPPRVQSDPTPQTQNGGFQNRAPQNIHPVIQNAPVGFNRVNNPVNATPTSPVRFQGNNQSRNSPSGDSRWNHDSGQQREIHNQGFNNNVRFNNNVSFNNNLNPNHVIHSNDQGFNRGPHFTPGWVNHYRMPYRHGSSGAYRVHYAQSWPSNYGWRVLGWREDYRTVDPYWYAVITSMAVAQAWSDAEIAQAINDDNLRQQLIYDADVRQQMIDSGYPANQIDYPDSGAGADGYAASYPDDQNVPPDYNSQDQYDQSQYPAQYNQGQVSTQTTQSGYYPPPDQPAPTSVNPNSPLYNGGQDTTAPSGEQIANLNANKNALFFCTAGNKSEAIQAFSQIQSPDMTVWKTMSSFDRCSAWAIP